MELIALLGSKNRLQILRHLSRNDMYVSEIMRNTNMDGRNTTMHLKKLEEAGLIKSYDKGRRKYYRLQKHVRLEIKPPPEGRFILFTT